MLATYKFMKIKIVEDMYYIHTHINSIILQILKEMVHKIGSS